MHGRPPEEGIVAGAESAGDLGAHDRPRQRQTLRRRADPAEPVEIARKRPEFGIEAVVGVEIAGERHERTADIVRGGLPRLVAETGEDRRQPVCAARDLRAERVEHLLLLALHVPDLALDLIERRRRCAGGGGGCRRGEHGNGTRDGRSRGLRTAGRPRRGLGDRLRRRNIEAGPPRGLGEARHHLLPLVERLLHVEQPVDLLRHGRMVDGAARIQPVDLRSQRRDAVLVALQ